MTIILVLFAIGYLLPIFIISDYNIFDEEFGLLRDNHFFPILVMSYSFVFVMKSISGRILNLLPENKNSKQHKSADIDKDKNLFNILTSDGFERYRLLFQKLTSPIADVLWSILLTAFVLTFSFNILWNFEGLYYNQKQLFPFTDIAGLTILIYSIIVGLTVGSGFGFILSFAFSILLLPWLRYFPYNKKDTQIDKEDPSLIYNISSLDMEETNRLSYNQLFKSVKQLSQLIFIIFFELLLILMLITIIITINQLISVDKIDFLPIFQIVIIDIIVVLVFIANLFSIQQLLKKLKNHILDLLDQEYQKLVNKILSTSQTSSDELSAIEYKLSSIIQIIKREESFSTRLIEFPQLLGLVIPIAAPLFGLALDFIQKQLT